MSSITGLSNGLSSYYAALNQQLFKSIDQNGDGSISQAELEQAFTANGGTTQAADQLYTALDPNSTGSVDEQQFSSGLQSLFSSQTQGALIQAQSDATGTQASGMQPHGHGGHHGALSQLFNSIDSNGDGSISQSELEQAFSAQGLSTSQADQLFAALDPNGTGSVDQQQFVSGMRSILQQAGGPSGASSPTSAAPSQGGDVEIQISISVTDPTAQTGDSTTASDAAASSSGTSAPSVEQNLSDLLNQILSAASGSAAGSSTDGSAAAGGSGGAGGSAAAGAGGSSSGTTSTEVTYNADGTVTTTVTNPDGTETVTTTGTPNTQTASGTNSANGSGATSNAASIDQLLQDFFSASNRLSSGVLSPGTLGQLLTQQQQQQAA